MYANHFRRIQQIPQHIALQRMPPGGLTSLLYHFSYVLKSTDETLQAIEKEDAWGRFLRMLWPVGGVVLATIALRLWMAAKQRRGRFNAASQTGLVVVAGIVVYRLLRRRHHLIARLRRLHRILLILLRIWLVTCHMFRKVNVARAASYAVLIADLDQEEQESAKGVAARELLEMASLPQDAAIWSFKTTHLALLKVGLDLSYASMSAGWEQVKRGRQWLRWPAVVCAAGYYLLFPGQAAEQAQHVMHEDIDIDFVKSVWMQLDSPAARQLSWLQSPRLVTNRAVEVRGVQCNVFSDRAVPSHVFEAAGPSSIRPPASPGPPSASLSLTGLSLACAASAREETVKGWGGGEHDDEMGSTKGHHSGRPSTAAAGMESHPPRSPRYSLSVAEIRPDSILNSRSRDEEAKKGEAEQGLDSVMLYIHGGGFVGTSFGLDSGMLAKWAKQEPRLVIVYVHYSLSPEVRYPVALDEITRVYKQLRSWSKRIVVIGESAGGNLAVALALRCVKERIRGPDSLVPVYPALNLNDTPSPSRALHINDPLVPIRLLKELAASYVPKEYMRRHCALPLVNPGLAPDELLEGLPSTHIVVGGLDPLLDDAIDFSTRLRRLGKSVSLSVYRNLPHGFINFDFVPEARVAVQAIFEMCLESVGLGREQTLDSPIIGALHDGADSNSRGSATARPMPADSSKPGSQSRSRSSPESVQRALDTDSPCDSGASKKRGMGMDLAPVPGGVGFGGAAGGGRAGIGIGIGMGMPSSDSGPGPAGPGPMRDSLLHVEVQKSGGHGQGQGQMRGGGELSFEKAHPGPQVGSLGESLRLGSGW